jgi:Gpi18-like mannosyltransferase
MLIKFFTKIGAAIMMFLKCERSNQKIREVILQHDREIFFFILIIISITIRVILTPYTELSPDYDTYISTWMQEYRLRGIVAGIANTIPGDDYYIPINLLYAVAAQIPVPFYVSVSAISCSAEFLTVFFLYKILSYLLQSPSSQNSKFSIKAALYASTILFIPAAILNGSYWKQCDAVYVCFLIISLYCVLKERYTAAVIWFSVSFCFKLQAIFFFPFLLIVWMLRRKFNFINFFWIPVVYIIAGIPAVLFHRGIKATYLIYYYQIQETTSFDDYGMNSYFPNIYAFGLDNFAAELQTPAVLFAGLIILAGIVFIVHYCKNIDNQKLFLICCWIAETCCVFLPGMHERYDYLYLVLITVYSITFRHRLIPVAITGCLCSLITYTMVFQLRGSMKLVVSLPVIAVFYIVAYSFLTYDLMRQIKD